MELDSENEKALYRRGEARLLKNEFSLALMDFRQVLQVNPSNRAARTRISVCQRKIREHHEQDKKIYANMFQRFAEHDAKVPENLQDLSWTHTAVHSHADVWETQCIHVQSILIREDTLSCF